MYQRKTVLLGKPAGVMVKQCVEALHCRPEECVVVADGLDTDIVFGKRDGMWTVLVLSGRTGEDEVGDGSRSRIMLWSRWWICRSS